MRAAMLAMLMTGCVTSSGQETLPPLAGQPAPRDLDELWAGFDPGLEPLDTEVLHEWEEDDVRLQVIRYRIGTFRGQTAMMAAVYGYPQGGADLPGLVQIHGGGQYADYRAPLYNAKHGYATISISWAGRITAPDYHVNPEGVQLFWDGKVDDPTYRPTTDWGALDAYHAPSRNPGNDFNGLSPQRWTLDDVESPRNSPWFLCTLAARRALTFLERQPEVDADRLGVYGHSMGGKLTVMTAAVDDRIKAAAPSCGGVSDRRSGNALYRATIGDDVHLRRISCPIVFLNPANDFHGRIDDLQLALSEIAGAQRRVTCSPHHNHQDNAEHQVAGLLWFDQHLRRAFVFPETPRAALSLRTEAGVPTFTVTPDGSREIISVDVYYTQQGPGTDAPESMDNAIHRFWRHAPPQPRDGAWVAEPPLLTADKPLWVYANVAYPLDEAIDGAGYYYAPYTAERFVLSSAMHIAAPADLQAAGVQATLAPTTVIETFEAGWQKEWFTYRPADWARSTHKVYDDRWQAPLDSKLAVDVLAERPNTLVVGLDKYAAEVDLAGGGDWQSVRLSAADFRDASGEALTGWNEIKELRLAAAETLRPSGEGEPRHVGGDWDGADPQFRNLRWVAE